MADKKTLQPYIYRRTSVEQYIFGFITEQEVEYQIRFKPTDYLFANIPEINSQTFEFIITPVLIPPGIKPAKDERIPITVATIFHNFYKELPDNVTIYICDSSDRKERARERLFNSWFYDFRREELFIKIDVGLDPKRPDKIDFSVIIKFDNPYKFDILYSIEKLKIDLERNK